MSFKIPRIGHASSDHVVSEPSTSATKPVDNPTTAATAKLPIAKLSALSAFSKTLKEKASRPIPPPEGNEVTTTKTKWDGVEIRTKPGDSKAFPEQVNKALEKIASKPNGKQLLEGIHNNPNEQYGYKVAITPQASEKRQTLFWRSRTYEGGNVTKSASDVNASTPGEGAVSAIKWNPQQTVTPDGKRPAFIGLAHEMIHADRNLKGESSLISKPSGSAAGIGEQGPDEIAAKKGSANPKVEDENQVVGLKEYANNPEYPVTENSIRKEHGLPERKKYSGLDK
jgi:hypothetical protein